MAANQLAMIYDWETNTQYRLPRFPNNHVVTYPSSAASALLPLTIANNWTPEGEHALTSGSPFRRLISLVSYSRLLWRIDCESQAQTLETILKDSRFETVQSNGSQHGRDQRRVEDRDDAGEGENDGRFHHDSRWKARTREWWIARNRYASPYCLSPLSLADPLSPFPTFSWLRERQRCDRSFERSWTSSQGSSLRSLCAKRQAFLLERYSVIKYRASLPFDRVSPNTRTFRAGFV